MLHNTGVHPQQVLTYPAVAKASNDTCQAASLWKLGAYFQIPPPWQNMFHWRQEPLVTIIITSIAKRRLTRIKLLHLA
jgi:hypothetical protein